MICSPVQPKNLLHQQVGHCGKNLLLTKLISVLLNYSLRCGLLTKQSTTAVKVLSCNVSLMRLSFFTHIHLYIYKNKIHGS